MLAGGCLCGKIRYEISAEPIHHTICHCVDCRRASGAFFVAWITVREADFRFVAGATKSHRSSAGVERAFCAECGTPLTYRNASFAGEVDVATGTLDRPGEVPPRDHTWVSQKPAWVVLADGLPHHARAGSES
ncbi:GFA family protein [Paraburkholderia sp. J41]|uniref:GFA family protein n=1 Tax=Paraburkholderia sp. J41 TaxID=2805433 RepID=UPI002AC36C35|nr:GFA family protein [Paraburkholderia sp. J41]